MPANGQPPFHGHCVDQRSESVLAEAPLRPDRGQPGLNRSGDGLLLPPLLEPNCRDPLPPPSEEREGLIQHPTTERPPSQRHRALLGHHRTARQVGRHDFDERSVAHDEPIKKYHNSQWHHRSRTEPRPSHPTALPRGLMAVEPEGHFGRDPNHTKADFSRR